MIFTGLLSFSGLSGEKMPQTGQSKQAVVTP
jgi:hypothetical protein